MDDSVSFDEGGGIDASDLPKCVFERLGRQRWIKAGEGLTQRIFQDDIAVARIAPNNLRTR